MKYYSRCLRVYASSFLLTSSIFSVVLLLLCVLFIFPLFSFGWRHYRKWCVTEAIVKYERGFCGHNDDANVHRTIAGDIKWLPWLSTFYKHERVDSPWCDDWTRALTKLTRIIVQSLACYFAVWLLKQQSGWLLNLFIFIVQCLFHIFSNLTFYESLHPVIVECSFSVRFSKIKLLEL